MVVDPSTNLSTPSINTITAETRNVSGGSQSPERTKFKKPLSPNGEPLHWHRNHTPPKNPVKFWFWRLKMVFDSTFVPTMLEPWERVILYMCFLLFFTLLTFGVVRYLPQHLRFLQRRAVYYLKGEL